MNSPQALRRIGAAAITLFTLTTGLCLAPTPAHAADVALPPTNAKFDYQLGGPYDPDPSVRVVSRDRLAKPAPGLYNICYVNLLQTQPDESGHRDASKEGTTAWWKKNHPELLLRNKGKYVMDTEWNEAVFDVRTPEKRQALFDIQKSWFSQCKTAGFNAIEPDNLEAETHSKGLFDHAAVREYLKLVVPHVHSLGLAIGQKNAIGSDKSKEWATDGPKFVDTVSPRQGFDFAIAEECQAYKECDTYTKMYPGRVFEVEYKRSKFDEACSARRDQISVVLRDKDVVPKGEKGHVYDEC